MDENVKEALKRFSASLRMTETISHVILRRNAPKELTICGIV